MLNALSRAGYTENVDCFHVHSLNRPTKIGEKLVLEHGLPRLIVTLTRELVNRNVSAFFQSIDLKNREGEWYVGERAAVLKFSDEQLRDAFLTRPAWKHMEAANWFDEELKRHTGIDVYAANFDKVKGWEVFENAKHKCLVMRVENLDPDVISEFVGIPVSVGEDNKADDKWYNELYRRFSVPESYIDAMHDTKYMRHFYAAGTDG